MKYFLFFFIIFFIKQSDRSRLGFDSPELTQFELHNNQIADRFLADEKLQASFPISDFFYPSTRFWFLIYTFFDDSKLVFHDRNNLNLIYQVQDFSSLEDKKIHRFAQSFIQDEFIKKRIKQLRDRLRELANHLVPSKPDQIALYNQVIKAGVTIGSSASKHRQTFIKLAQGVRVQRGLKNHIEAGFSRYNIYSSFLDRYFTSLKLPHELMAIAFLESSFNPQAHSKSQAAGVWQLMPFLQKSFFPVHSSIDYRLNIGISSIAAAHLLKENYQILKRWDLALTAYNSGIKHILHERKKNKSLTLEQLIVSSGHSSFGFASKNFYAEFLALTRVLKYKDELFPATQAIDPLQDLKFFFTKCDVSLKKSFSPTQQQYLRSLNHQLNNVATLKKGTLITSDGDFTGRIYQQVPWNDLVRKRPKDWAKIGRSYSCSTR